MSTRYRFDCPGSLHHVMSHSVAGKDVFENPVDCSDFVSRVSGLVESGNWRIHAWVLMYNHFHLLAEPLDETLSLSMQKLLTGFAVTYNLRNEMKGHVFRNRFKSILVEKEKYFIDLVRYIHLNPVRAGITKTLDELADYRWSGHAAITGKRKYPWQSKALVKFMFQSDEKNWYEQYIEFLAEPSDIDSNTFDSGNYAISRAGLEISDDGEIIPENSNCSRMLSSREFAVNKYNEVASIRGIEKRNRKSQHDMIETVLQIASELSGVSQSAIRSGHGNRRVVWIRTIVAKVLVSEAGISLSDIARYLNMSSSSVHYMVKKKLEPASAELELTIRQSI